MDAVTGGNAGMQLRIKKKKRNKMTKLKKNVQRGFGTSVNC